MDERVQARLRRGVGQHLAAWRMRLRPRHAAWAALLGLALGLRLAGIGGTSVWHDEAMTVHTASMGAYDLIVRMSVANNQPPLIFLLFKLWAVVSWSPVWLRLFSVGISLLAVVFAVLWLRLWDRRAGWMAGLLVATCPLMVHYAQEIRAYALLYTCLLAGLYCGERLARRYARSVRAGLLLCVFLMSYAHYIGLVGAVGLLVYTALRGTGWRRTGVLAAVWAALSLPVISLGLYHASEKQATGFWVPPLTWTRLGELLATWTGHSHLARLEEVASTSLGHWLVLSGWALLGAGLGTALIVSLVCGPRDERTAAWSMVTASAAFLFVVILISAMTVPVAIERTTFPAFIVVMGAVALACAARVPKWCRRIGLAACLLVAAVWVNGWLCFVRRCPERRPAEAELFGPIAARFQPGDVLVAFPANMQASAGYFMRQVAGPEQIQSTDFPRFQEGSRALELKPIPRGHDSAWFGRVRMAIARRRLAHPDQHAVWVVDLGVKSAANPRRQRLQDWLRLEYVTVDDIQVGDRWPLAARRYVSNIAQSPAATGNEITE